MHIAMIGTGYVGLVTGVCLAEVGHEVTCVDIDKNKIAQLEKGISPIYEPGIESLILKNLQDKRLFFTHSLEDALNKTAVIFIAVGTPPQEDGSADLQHVMSLAKTIGQKAQRDLVLIVKSTVPVGSCEKVESTVKEELKKRNVSFKITVASNPEFLKEGTAIADFMKPDRIVVGLKDKEDDEIFKQLYRPFIVDDPNRLIIVKRRSSELTKYAANAMLATRISFMNELSMLSEKLVVDIDEVRIGIGSDPRIGKKFLYAGPGYGGSCFPKDVSALVKMGQQQGLPLQILSAVQEVNQQQIRRVTAKIKEHFKDLKGLKIALWGLAFKPGTDDVREAPSKTLVETLLKQGAQIIAHDPQARHKFEEEFGSHPALSYGDKAYDVLRNADALVLLTEWTEYKWPDWEKVSALMNQKIVFDFRNQYQFTTLTDLGFHYQCVGRPDSHAR